MEKRKPPKGWNSAKIIREEREKRTEQILGFTEEYRDKHWKKCRFSEDPRTCGGAYYPKGKATEFIMQNHQPLCSRDNLECDAHWVE